VANEHGAEASSTSRAGAILVAWMGMLVLLQAVLWVSGAETTRVGEAVEFGAAKAETRGIGEQADEVVRKAIRLQQDTRPFWITLALLGDFVFEPLGLAFRALLVATLFSGLAALKSRPSGFRQALTACALAQGFWVLGLAVRTALTLILKRPEVETSPALLLSPGLYPAAVVVAMRQLDVFALLGWLTMALGGWKRRQVGFLGAFVVCGMLWGIESIVRMETSLVIGAGTRLSLMPEVPR
jgi:hypothetical protein